MFNSLALALGMSVISGVSLSQRVLDPGFAAAGSHTLIGSGLGTSAVVGGVLQITSTTNVYFERPTYISGLLLEAGTYTTVYTVLNYATGSILA